MARSEAGRAPPLATPVVARQVSPKRKSDGGDIMMTYDDESWCRRTQRTQGLWSASFESDLLLFNPTGPLNPSSPAWMGAVHTANSVPLP